MAADQLRPFDAFAKRAHAASRLVAGAVLPLSAVTPALAAPLLGDFYFALNGGLNALEASHIDYAGDVLPRLRTSFDAGWVGSGAIGWRMRDFYRIEFEGAYRENRISDIDPGISPGGRIKATTAMVNGYFDFPTYEGVIPHVGIGLGRAQLVHEFQVDGSNLADSNSHAFAYQVIGGLEFPIVSYSLASTLEYRYLSTTRETFQDVNGFFYHAHYYSHAVLLGLRWAF